MVDCSGILNARFPGHGRNPWTPRNSVNTKHQGLTLFAFRSHFSTVSFFSFFLTRKSRKQLLHLYGDMMLKYIFLPGGDLRGTARICFLQNGHRRSTLLNIPKISTDAKSHNHPSSLLFGPKTGKTIKTQTNIDTINHQYFFLILRNRRSQSSLSTEVFLLVIKQVFHLVNCFFNPFPVGLNHPLHKPHPCASNT